MLKRKGSWILFLPVLAGIVSAGIVTHQYVRRNRMKTEWQAAEKEYDRLAALLPSKYKHRIADSHHHDHDHEHSH